ncbi:MAG: flagellar hook-basal body complex protein FliE [Desulfatiglandaceae bacterium]
MNEITVKNRLEMPTPLQGQEKSSPKTQEGSFANMLSGAINETDRLRKAADVAVTDLASGNNTDIHKTMIAMEKASVSFKLMMEVRNKVISAYQEIIRTQV